MVSFLLILNLLPSNLNTKDLIKCLKNVDTFLDNDSKMKVWKLLTVLFCGYKFIDRGFEVLCFKTYCLFTKVTIIITRQAVSPYESWHCWIERWKSLNKNSECTSWSVLTSLGLLWILNDVIHTEKFLYSYKYQLHN